MIFFIRSSSQIIHIYFIFFFLPYNIIIFNLRYIRSHYIKTTFVWGDTLVFLTFLIIQHFNAILEWYNNAIYLGLFCILEVFEHLLKKLFLSYHHNYMLSYHHNHMFYVVSKHLFM